MAYKHQAFIDKYFAEADRFDQLTMLKEYMLALPVDDLLEFTLEPIQFLSKELEGKKLTADQKERLFEELGEISSMLRMKAAL